MELGPGNGNLAACFLSHLKVLDKDGVIYPRIRYVLVDWEQAVLDAALAHPELASHRDRVETHRGTVDRLDGVADGSVDRIICNELWNDLPTKLMSRQANDIEEEFLRPNVSEALHAKISDWAAFVRAFDAMDIEALKGFPPFLDDLVWEREYRTVEWKEVPYRKTITDFLKRIDEHVLVPVNLGAYATIKEAKRLLAPEAIGFSSFDAGTADMHVLNDPEKPCYGQFGGQQSFMVNFALAEAVAKQLEAGTMTIESQREFVGRSLGTNVLTLMDLIATHPSAGTRMAPWEQDRLMLKTLRALNETYRSPYARHLDFPIPLEMPPEEREVAPGPCALAHADRHSGHRRLSHRGRAEPGLEGPRRHRLRSSVVHDCLDRTTEPCGLLSLPSSDLADFSRPNGLMAEFLCLTQFLFFYSLYNLLLV